MPYRKQVGKLLAAPARRECERKIKKEEKRKQHQQEPARVDVSLWLNGKNQSTAWIRRHWQPAQAAMECEPQASSLLVSYSSLASPLPLAPPNSGPSSTTTHYEPTSMTQRARRKSSADSSDRLACSCRANNFCATERNVPRLMNCARECAIARRARHEEAGSVELGRDICCGCGGGGWCTGWCTGCASSQGHKSQPDS